MSNLTNRYGLPDALYHAVMNDPYTGGGDISVTKLIDSAQRRVLLKKHGHAVVEDVSERLWALMGQAVHTVLERAGTSALVEKRLYAEVEGWKLSGQFDRLHLANKTLQDWKVCSTYKSGGDEGWARQLNILRWLAIVNGYEVDKLEVIAIFRDWRRTESVRNHEYPQQPIQIIQIPVWEISETVRYVTDRIALHQQASAGAKIDCTEDERWYSGTTYALMKNGGKRAIKVSAVREDLGEVKDGYFIEKRDGEYRRCEGYCEVAPFCEQFQNSKKGSTDDVGA